MDSAAGSRFRFTPCTQKLVWMLVLFVYAELRVSQFAIVVHLKIMVIETPGFLGPRRALFCLQATSQEVPDHPGCAPQLPVTINYRP